jgi:ribosomal protein S18 acetylase RimI-like enzyme
VEIVQLGPTDAQKVQDAAHLFDGPPLADAVDRFLADDRHHLFLAYEDERPVGFVSGVELTHPDKGTEMFLYEIAVDEAYRRRGIGRALVRTLGELASARGCYGMFVLTENENDAALAAYATDGSLREDGFVMFTWEPPRPQDAPGRETPPEAD